MLIAHRNGMMVGKGGPYKRKLEYIESTGTQYIDLGKTIQPNVDFEFTGTIVEDAANGCIFGESSFFSWGNDNPAYSLITTTGGTVYLRYGNSSANPIGMTSVGIGNVFTAALSATDFVINGQTVATVSRISSFSSDVGTMAVFSRNFVNGVGITFAKVRVNHIRFGNVADLIPVLDHNDTPCMYDRVSVALFYNAGTGDFVIGPEL